MISKFCCLVVRPERRRLSTRIRCPTGRPHLPPWLSEAPGRFFRDPLCHWSNTEEKRTKVLKHLAAAGCRPVDVSSWWCVWQWRRQQGPSVNPVAWNGRSKFDSGRTPLTALRRPEGKADVAVRLSAS